jgi:peptidoglycan hydrolase CwlO-like protein
MKKLLLVFAILSFFLWIKPATAIECDGFPPSGADKVSLIEEYITKCNEKIAALKGQQLTLTQTISTLTSKINLAQAQINQTQAQINLLEKEVTVLDGVLETVTDSMDQLEKIYLARVRESYKRFRVTSLDLIFSTNSIGDYFTKLKYLNTVKAKDQLILAELERSRKDYDQRKQDKVQKQLEVEKLKAKLVAQRKILDVQQKEKQNLLTQTQNDEKKFQSLLNQARSELEAINAVIAGKGVETEVGSVKAGDTIAKVISGSSCNSSGTHLHFVVGQDHTVKNPFNYLKSVDYENCSGSSCGSSDGDSFNPTGSWDWPLNPKISLFQGFGITWAINHTWVSSIYSFHNGIDLKSGSADVKAVQNGILFRGSYSGSNGCALRYVRVQHTDGGLDTYYLHVNYF